MNLENLSQYKAVYIQPHNFPDADAIASAYGVYELLENLGINSKIICATPRDKSLKPNLDKMLRNIESDITFSVPTIPEDKEDFALVIVDVQYGNSNLTEIDAKYIYCIDHHEDSLNEVYIESDIRPNIGSSSTIVTEYYRKYNLIPSTIAATLLSFGIYQDTGSLSEKTTNLDTECKMWLNDKVDTVLYNDLIHSAFTFDDMKLFAKALEGIHQYRNIAFLRMDSSDDNMLGNASDIVSEISDVDIVIAYSERKFGWKLSVRSYNKIISAVDVIEYITEHFVAKGGGHANKSGGFIPLEEFTRKFPNISFDPWLKSEIIFYTNKWGVAPQLTTDTIVDSNILEKCITATKKQLPIRYIDLGSIEDEYIGISTLTGGVKFNTNTHNIIIGIKGDVYPIGKDTFDKYYTPIEGSSIVCIGDSEVKKGYTKDGYGMKIGGKKYKYSEILTLPVAMPSLGKRLVYRLEEPMILYKGNSILKGEPGDYLLIKNNKPSHINCKYVFEASFDISNEKFKTSIGK